MMRSHSFFVVLFLYLRGASRVAFANELNDPHRTVWCPVVGDVVNGARSVTGPVFFLFSNMYGCHCLPQALVYLTNFLIFYVWNARDPEGMHRELSRSDYLLAAVVLCWALAS